MSGNTKAYLALAFICVVWGTTYLAIRVGVMHYPPFLFAGVRQFVSGIILITAALAINRNKDISRQNILRQMLIGFLMLSIGNGCVTYGEKIIPSGIAALVCSLMPLFAVLMNLFSSSRDHFNWMIGAGLLLGVAGVGFIVGPGVTGMSSGNYVTGVLSVLLATCSWALGSTINKKNAGAVNPFFNSGLQLFFGGLFMLIISPVADDLRQPLVWNSDGMLALLYLIVFGSVLAYAAYMYSLSKLPVGIATIYAYINPLVAVLMGYVILREPLGVYTILAFATIIASVFLVNSGYRRQHKIIITKEPTTIGAFPEDAPVES